MTSSRARSTLAFGQTVAWFIHHAEWGGYFWTLTFPAVFPASLGASKALFGKVEDWLRRTYPHASWVGVWELQQRGAWHPHFVTDKRIDVVALREFATSIGFGPQMKVKAVIDKSWLNRIQARHWRYIDLAAWEARTVRYLTKYLVKGQRAGEAEIAAGSCSLVFAGGRRGKEWSSACRFVGYAGRAWRMGVEMFVTLHGVYPQWKQFGQVMDLGWEAMRTSHEDLPAHQEWVFHDLVEHNCPF